MSTEGGKLYAPYYAAVVQQVFCEQTCAPEGEENRPTSFRFGDSRFGDGMGNGSLHASTTMLVISQPKVPCVATVRDTAGAIEAANLFKPYTLQPN